MLKIILLSVLALVILFFCLLLYGAYLAFKHSDETVAEWYRLNK